MARKMLRPYYFLFYFQAILVGFFFGVMYAGWIEAGKGQMLAAGAIVLGYGVLGSGIGLVTSLAVAWWSGSHTILGINGLMALMLSGFIIYYFIVFRGKHSSESSDSHSETVTPDTLSSPYVDTRETLAEAMDLLESDASNKKMENQLLISMGTGPDMGLGMFAPALAVGEPLYFYGHPIQGWPPSKQDIVDSVTFHLDKYENLAIATAPPWFVPAHQKIDYGFLFMKIRTALRNTLELEVNKLDGRTALVHLEAGRIIYWPEFLLGVYSIELLDKDHQIIRVKPFDYAGEVDKGFDFLQPIAIRANWIKVELKSSDLDTVGQGWVKWRENGRLLVGYSLLS